MTSVGGVTMDPTVGSIFVVFAVAGLGLHGGDQGGHLRLGGIGRGLAACHSKRVFRWRWNGYYCHKGRSGHHCCDVSGVVSCLAGSREKGGAVLLGLGEQFLNFFMFLSMSRILGHSRHASAKSPVFAISV